MGKADTCECSTEKGTSDRRAEGKSIGACLFQDFPGSLQPSRELLETSLPANLQLLHSRSYDESQDDSARDKAVADLTALVTEHLPDLPPYKEMGVGPVVRFSL